jgi:hypothetical protein
MDLLLSPLLLSHNTDDGYKAWKEQLPLLGQNIVMNHVTPVTNEAPITFGHVKLQFYINLYNMQITYLLMVILLAMADMKACFQFARIHGNLSSTFGFLAGSYYNLATAMIICSTVSAFS